MSGLIAWLEAHDKLAGWAQFLGAMLALILTYITAFAPIWRRKRQLASAAQRLLLHGYESIESYHRVIGNFIPQPISLEGAAMTMGSMAEEISRFPIYELDDHGSLSVARRLVAMSAVLNGLRLYLNEMAKAFELQPGTEEDRDIIRNMLAQQLQVAEGLVAGKAMKRPVWPSAEPST